jgi:hypothetical protein
MKNLDVATRPDAPTAELTQLLHAIAGRLSGAVPAELPGFGVAQSLGGALLFNCHYAAFTGDSRYYDLALAQLEAIMGRLDPHTYQSHAGSKYFQELAELGALLDYLVRAGHLEWDAEPLLRQFDALLESRLPQYLAANNLEIVHGALSVGQYFRRRLPHSATARRVLTTLLDHLQASQEGDEEQGYYWTCHVIKEPRVYTSLSHGSAMVINFVAALAEVGFEPEKCARLLRYATRFVLQTRMDPAQFIASIPIWRGRLEPTPNLGLLYGDPSTAFALARAAKVLADDALLAEAIAIALPSTRERAPHAPFAHDASVYYGTSGAYLVYDGLYRLTGVADFARAGARWLAATPAQAVYQNDELNFSTNYHQVSQNPLVQLGFNFGLLGIGLTLLHALSARRQPLDEFIWLA